MKYQNLGNKLIESAKEMYSDNVEIKLCVSMASSEDDKYWSIEWVDTHTFRTKEFYTIVEALKEHKRVLALPLEERLKYKID